jgi:hypothetical protein
MMMTAATGGFADYRNLFKPIVSHHQLNFRWRNQRQVRKNRRRAHAAGIKNAFKS